VKELKRELAHLSAIRPVMRVALRERDIRQDGFPRANARPEHPGIVLAFGREAKSKRFASRAAARNYLLAFARAEGVTDGLTADRLYRLASKATHPDKGGTREDWDKVSEAHRLLTQEDSYQFACDRFHGLGGQPAGDHQDARGAARRRPLRGRAGRRAVQRLQAADRRRRA
jgi:hypothetical protein